MKVIRFGGAWCHIRTMIQVLLAVWIFFSYTRSVFAADVTLHFFWSSGCPHCAKEKEFLNTLKEQYPQLIIKDYEITYSQKNLALLQKVGTELQANTSGVPFTVIGKEQFVGYLSNETTGKEIKEAVQRAAESGYEDIVTNLSQGLVSDHATNNKELQRTPEYLKVPFFGELQVKSLSLPLLTIILAFLDGFNPCAMWTLLFLISLLLGMKDRKRMWLLGVTFIVSSAVVYFLFLSAWLNVFLFLGFVVWIRILIGIGSIGAGGYYLRDYWINKSGSCSVMGDTKRQKVFQKLTKITQKRQILLALGGIALLAIAVNMIELICSAGLPAIYTNILSLSRLPSWQYYAYLLLYIFIFMLDDLFIFFTAMITLKAVGIQSKYSRFSHLIGGLLMVAIGLLLLFKPEWLMFG
jgi:thiol-disulfide isomerase/thioredoxin